LRFWSSSRLRGPLENLRPVPGTSRNTPKRLSGRKVGQSREGSIMKVCLWVLLVALGTVTRAQSVPPSPESALSTLLHSLAETNIFAFGPVGFGMS
jgi:hypothetical protein